MKGRNKYLELDGLYWESETHEWFHDKSSTSYAHMKKGMNDITMDNLYCFIVRDINTGVYNRVIMDSETNEIIYESKSLEDIGVRIDMLRILKSTP